jgi:hypothetical protein
MLALNGQDAEKEEIALCLRKMDASKEVREFEGTHFEIKIIIFWDLPLFSLVDI